MMMVVSSGSERASAISRRREWWRRRRERSERRALVARAEYWMVRRKRSVPEGVEKMRWRWESVLSVFLMYRGSQARRVFGLCRCGVEGANGKGIGGVWSGGASGGGTPVNSDIMAV